MAVAVEILADEGWGRLNSDRVAARARAGKAGIYRRWPTMAALARHALNTAPHQRVALLGSAVQALWWQRYTAFAPAPMSTAQVEQLVTDVLLPIVEPALLPPG